MASLRVGADLVHVFCEKSAAPVIKSYSPDLIVHPYLPPASADDMAVKDCAEKICPWIDRLHALVIGPGLGRDANIQTCTREVIKYAKSKSLPLIVDADGLCLIESDPDLIRGYSKGILTPNVVEFGRLCNRLNIIADIEQLASALQTTVVQKGKADSISSPWLKGARLCSEEGSLKRVGGQGDILSGTIATLAAWVHLGCCNTPEAKDIDERVRYAMAAYAGCVVTRRSARLAFRKKGQSLITSDILEYIGPAFADFEKNVFEWQ